MMVSHAALAAVAYSPDTCRPRLRRSSKNMTEVAVFNSQSGQEANDFDHAHAHMKDTVAHSIVTMRNLLDNKI